jgi:hypothetical protein
VTCTLKQTFREDHACDDSVFCLLTIPRLNDWHIIYVTLVQTVESHNAWTVNVMTKGYCDCDCVLLQRNFHDSEINIIVAVTMCKDSKLTFPACTRIEVGGKVSFYRLYVLIAWTNMN